MPYATGKTKENQTTKAAKKKAWEETYMDSRAEEMQRAKDIIAQDRASYEVNKANMPIELLSDEDQRQRLGVINKQQSIPATVPLAVPVASLRQMNANLGAYPTADTPPMFSPNLGGQNGISGVPTIMYPTYDPNYSKGMNSVANIPTYDKTSWENSYDEHLQTLKKLGLK